LRRSNRYTPTGQKTRIRLEAVTLLCAGESLVAVEARPQGTQVTQETSVHVVGNDRPALTYEGIVLYVK